MLDSQAIQNMQTKQIARQMAILPQGPQAPEGLTVLQLVKQGRYPYQTWLKQWSEKDEGNGTESTCSNRDDRIC